MRSWLLEYLRCPACSDGALDFARKDVSHILSTDGVADEVVVRGVLECVPCRARYPILDEAPRMLPPADLHQDEREVLREPTERGTAHGTASQHSIDEMDAMVADRIMADYGSPVAGPRLRRAREDIAYQHSYEDSRIYQMRLLHGLLDRQPSLIVDVGGGHGGNLRAARRTFSFQYGIVADLDARWPPLFRTGDRRLVYIRADATRLPLRTRCAGLAISSFLLEHVHPWMDIVLEINRLSRFTFIAFGPNRAFPYEFGHVNAPLAHALPLPLGALLACLWERMSSDRRSYGRLKEILTGMNYITSRTYYSFCRRKGIASTNLFTDMLQAWAQAGDSPGRTLLARHPHILRAFGRTMAAAGMEPNVYSLLREP